ncbi:MAG TPA: alpha-galactosidase [Bacilli bacterium]|nr:alpha-galactosidase [Bacilli bacterium]
MIKAIDNHFVLETKQTSYVITYTKSGLLLHDYYGAKVEFVDFECIRQKLENGRGTAVLFENNKDEFIDDLDLEVSTIGVGDYRENMLTINASIHGYTNCFKYQGYEILAASPIEPLPCSYGETESLKINLYDEVLECQLELYYKVYYEADVITRYARIINLSDKSYNIERFFSNQIDFSENDFVMLTFDGAWSTERHVNKKRLTSGIYINDSKSGVSSNKHNPLVILKKKTTTESSGECYGFNLVYSGNHKTLIEVKTNAKVRLLSGINDFAFNYTLEKEFITPEAIMTYSPAGLNALSQNMHYFVNNHIVRGVWKNKERPVLVNNWEATYFNFDEKKLLTLAKASKDVGIELFVLDDGWFGNRNDDTSSLGDYNVNLKKLPKGLKSLCDKVNNLDMMFGLWVEPEMVSPDSNLYRSHPEWAIQVPNRKPSIGRNQLVLDLTNPQVREYLIESLTEVFSSCNLSYVKWDFNRPLTDMWGSTLNNQGEFFHKYNLGLYEILAAINQRFPQILFEGCASGGNRFDLGMLCYFPQIWTSDDTDYLERLYIQTGTSYGYPLSTIGAHVSDAPNHQTLRKTPLASRFNISMFGVLGYELNIATLTNQEITEIKKQVDIYKTHRHALQYGKFYRSSKTIFAKNNSYFWVVDQDKAVVAFFQSLVHPNQPEDIMYIYGLPEQGVYKFKNISQKINLKTFGGLINIVSPIKLKLNGKLHNFVSRVYQLKSAQEEYLITGEMVKKAGVRLKGQFLGTGFNSNVRVLGDFGSCIYILEKENL